MIRLGVLVAALAACCLLVAPAGLAAPPSARDWAAAAERSTYQEVQLRTGQVLYGHVRARGNLVALADVYYRKPKTKKLILVRRGGEPEGSTSPILIHPDAIVLMINIGKDSPVAQAIAKLAKK